MHQTDVLWPVGFRRPGESAAGSAKPPYEVRLSRRRGAETRRIVTAIGRRGRSGGPPGTPRDARGGIDLYERQVKAV